jgi:hypothetical protein
MSHFTEEELAATWPEWTAITTAWADPGGEDPDEYSAECYRCQDANRTPYTAAGTRAECVTWAQSHSTDPDPTPVLPPAPPKKGGRP